MSHPVIVDTNSSFGSDTASPVSSPPINGGANFTPKLVKVNTFSLAKSASPFYKMAEDATPPPPAAPAVAPAANKQGSPSDSNESNYYDVEPGSPDTVSNHLVHNSATTTEDESPSTSDPEDGSNNGLQTQLSQPVVGILATAKSGGMDAARLNKIRRNVSWTDLAIGEDLEQIQYYHPQKPPSPIAWESQEAEHDQVTSGCACVVM